MQNKVAERIQGKVSTYSDSVKSGLLVAENRQMYLFSLQEWISELPPAANLAVSFVAFRGWAKSIRTGEPEMENPLNL